jgi:predicted Zn-dependent protease
LTTRTRFALATLAIAMAACTTVRNPVTGQRELTVMDEQSEVAEGTKAHAEILKEYTRLDNAALQTYVNDVGQKLAAQSHRANLKWTFTVLDSPEVNAFALPGGYVYITRGIMAYLDSEADLAGVIGHEIGHVTARHGAQRATSQARASAGVMAATVLGVLAEVAGVGGAAQVASQAAQGVAAGRIASYGREQELEADRLGAEYLAKTRYNPSNMVDVIQVLADQERFAADAAKAAGKAPPQGGGWLASHPANDLRLAQIRAKSGEWGPQFAATWADDGRARFLRAMEGVTFGDGREQGVVRGRNFFHEPLGIAMTAPEGWRIVNASDRLAIVNAAGDAAVVMRLVPDDLIKKTGTDHEAILRQGLGATQGRAERLTLGGGLNATSFSGQRRNQQGQTEPLEVTVVNGPGAASSSVYLLGRMAKDAAARSRVQGAVREIETSFRPLTTADRTAARPWRIRTTAMPAGGFAQLARSGPAGAGGEQQLRLLNGVYTAAKDPAAGTLVKVID